MQIEETLFPLLRLGLETEQPSEETLGVVAQTQGRQWERLKKLADQQGVSAIVLDGINTLCSVYGQERISASSGLAKWKQFVIRWTGALLAIEKANLHQQEVMNALAGRWSAQGCRVMVMKGQANGTFYPRPAHRSPGDIDCYLFDGYAQGNDIARQAGAQVDESWYKHSVISYQGETFENHQFFVHTREGKRSKLLEKELEEALNVPEKDFPHFPFPSSLVMPPVQWNAMFLTYHACAHFLSEGLRLKQVLDWAMFLQKHQDDADWPAFYAFCDRHHLRHFADALTAISVQYLGIRITNPAITTSSPYADKILHSALYDDDYVFATGSGWRARWHIVRNLFRYRWKYEDIYEQSIYRQLWYYATGYLLKTEKQ